MRREEKRRGVKIEMMVLHLESKKRGENKKRYKMILKIKVKVYKGENG